MTAYTATYSPDDNKLRLYASSRLDPETYARVRSAGFIWAPKQGLFVAPMWTPDRAELLLELADDIGDEDTSLIDRAEERSDRFTDYPPRAHRGCRTRNTPRSTASRAGSRLGSRSLWAITPRSTRARMNVNTAIMVLEGV